MGIPVYGLLPYETSRNWRPREENFVLGVDFIGYTVYEITSPLIILLSWNIRVWKR